MAKTKAQLEKRKRETEKRKRTEKAILKIAAAMPDDTPATGTAIPEAKPDPHQGKI
jgi:hypothetical protein